MSMFVTPIHNVCLVVSDIEKALSFWRDTLGWEVIVDHVISGDVEARFLGLPEYKQHRAVVLCQAKKVFTGMIELAEVSPPGKPFPRDEKFNDVGIRLLCFLVADVDKAYQELRAKGCKFHSPPQLTEIPGGVPIKVAFFREPVDGIQIEIFQYLESEPWKRRRPAPTA